MLTVRNSGVLPVHLAAMSKLLMLNYRPTDQKLVFTTLYITKSKMDVSVKT